MKILNRKHFDLPGDPWAGVEIQTADAYRIGEMVTAAIDSRAMVSILGQRGSGKTHSVRAALRSADVRLVEPLRLTRDKLHMGDIETAIVRELSDESPRRSGEARSHQVRHILGRASREQRIVLVIDDAHVLHGLTLRALKRLRELAWMGRSPLLGIVLIGQVDKTAAIPEVGLRSDRLWLSGLSADEASRVVRQVLGDVIDHLAARVVVSSDQARNWLDLQALIDDCLAEAIVQGSETITLAVANAVLGGPAPAAVSKTAAASEAEVGAYLASHQARKVA